MNKTLENISEAIKDQGKNISEVVKERLFSPMYFYFIIAWIITNWKFVYVFLNTKENFIFESKKIFKVEYLDSFYNFSSISEFFVSSIKLFFIPAISTFIVVWWLSKLSEKFYDKSESYKSNKRIIKNNILYKEKVIYAKDQRRIRDIESDKNKIRYDDNKEFNDWYDSEKENVIVGEYEFLPSESLYNNDYKAYQQEFLEYKERKRNGKLDEDDFEF